MPRPLPPAQHALYSDLLGQGGEGLFDPEFPENGSITIRRGRSGSGASEGYTYFHGYRPAAGSADRPYRHSRYIGKASDPTVMARIARFNGIKAGRADRATTVKALIGAGMPAPHPIAGRIVEALARAGLFPDQAVLLGDVADQTYDGVLGARLLKQVSVSSKGMCSDLTIALRDLAQIARLLDGLRAIDPGFAPVTDDLVHPSAMSFETASQIRVDVLLAVGEAPDHEDRISFLIDRPVPAIVLHGPGIPVSVPAPERFAVHALIVHCVGPDGPYPAERDLGRAAELIEALDMAGREHALTQLITEALNRNPEWRPRLRAGIQTLPWPYRALLQGPLIDPGRRQLIPPETSFQSFRGPID